MGVRRTHFMETIDRSACGLPGTAVQTADPAQVSCRTCYYVWSQTQSPWADKKAEAGGRNLKKGDGA